MISAAVVCPAAPFLVPGLAPTMAATAADVVQASLEAVTALRGLDIVVVLSAGPMPRTGDDRPAATEAAWGPGDQIRGARFGRGDQPVVDPVRLPGAPAVRATSVPAQPCAGTIVGAYMLAAAGVTAETHVLQNASDPDRVSSWLGRRAARRRAGLLVMADGAACHGDHAPGGPDDRAEAFDGAIVTAVASGDPAALARLETDQRDLARHLRAETFPAFGAMAAAVAGSSIAQAEVLHYSAPFGIGYLAATWRWDSDR